TTQESDTTPDLTWIRGPLRVTWENTEDSLGIGHPILELRLQISFPLHRTYATYPRTKLTDWPKTRADLDTVHMDTLSLEAWSTTILATIQKHTKEIAHTEDQPYECADHVDIEHWLDLCNNFNSQLHAIGIWDLFRNLLGLAKPKHTLQKLLLAQHLEPSTLIEDIHCIKYIMLPNLPEAKIDELLTHTNRVWATGHLPQEWKTDHVILLPKPGRPTTTPTNLRPISMTSCARNALCKTAWTLSKLKPNPSVSNALPKYRNMSSARIKTKNNRPLSIPQPPQRRRPPHPPSSTHPILDFIYQQYGRSTAWKTAITKEIHLIYNMLHQITRHTHGLKEHECCTIMEAAVYFRVLYHLPYLILPKTQYTKRENAIRKCLRKELGVSTYALNFLITPAALHNSLEKKTEAHVAGQYHRLSTSKQGRTILSTLRYPTTHLSPLSLRTPTAGHDSSHCSQTHPPTHEPDRGSPKTPKQSPSSSHTTARYLFHGCRPHRRYLYHHHSGAAEAQSTAEAIPLQPRSADSITIRSDSQGPFRDFSNSVPAHIKHDLTSYMAAYPHLHVFKGGNERAHALARANETPSNSESWPPDYNSKAERAAHRKAQRQRLEDLRLSRRNLPPPTPNLTRHRSIYICQAQIFSLPCDLTTHHIINRPGTPHSDARRTYWYCPRAQQPPRFLLPHPLYLGELGYSPLGPPPCFLASPSAAHLPCAGPRHMGDVRGPTHGTCAGPHPIIQGPPEVQLKARPGEERKARREKRAMKGERRKGEH
ncbi:hypothetical protein HPB47_023194, partial [Ixodes persulcatus]